MPEPQSDPIADMLRATQTSDRVRAAAWDAFYQSTNTDELDAKLRGLSLPTSITANLLKAKAGPDAAGAWEDRGLAGSVWHPANDVTESKREDNSLLGFPPELAVMGGLGVGRAMAGEGLSLAGRAAAGAKEAVTQVAPAVKYEAVKTGLEHMGVPTSVAIVIAMGVSGYKRGAKRATGETATASADAASASRVESTPAAPARPSESGAQSASPRSSAAPESSPPPQGMTQKQLNEEALARRRAEYQARVAQQPQAPAAEPGNVKLSAAETKAYIDLLKRGVPSRKAMQSILQQRELVQRLGTPAPTYQDTTFPKGMRGKVPPSRGDN